MYFCLDIGNSFTKLGIFDGQTLIHKTNISTAKLSQAKLKTWIAAYKPKASIVSNVSGKELSFDSLSKKTILLSHKTPLPIALNYKTPATLGKDRIALAAGAWALFPKKPVLVLSLGTCFTHEFIDQDGVYQGGGIAPGLNMRLKAMHQLTGKLPEVSLPKNTLRYSIGKSTKECMLLGAMNGLALELKGLEDQYTAVFRNVNVILTGGDAIYFENTLKNRTFAEPHLSLMGLNHILQFNLSAR